MTDRFGYVREVLAREVEQDSFPGGVWGVASGGEVLALEAFGNRDNDPALPATANTLYDMASVTKPVACATAAMLCIERGLFHAKEEARAWFPEHTLPHWEGVTIHHLLTHTSGLPDWNALYMTGTGDESALKAVFAQSMKAAPGARYEYSCLGYITLGKIVERATKAALDTFTRSEVFEPLGMLCTGYRRISTTPKPEADADIAPTRGGDRDRGKLIGEVHDGNASGMDGVSGNAGLFSTAGDMLRYGRMLLNGGTLEGTRILSPLSVRLMTTSRIEAAVGGHGYGFFTAPNGMSPAGDLLSTGSASHTGFTGTSLLVHGELGLTAVLLTNRVMCDGGGHLRARRRFHNALAAAVTR